MTDGPAKRGEARLIIITVVVVLAAGGVIMGGIYALLKIGDPGKAALCRGWQQIGEIDSVTKLATGSADPYDLGNGCEVSLVEHGGKLLAVKPRLASCNVPLQWVKKPGSFYCAKQSNLVDWSDLQYWPTRVVRHGKLRDLEIDFGQR